jgi:hypothetical protein
MSNQIKRDSPGVRLTRRITPRWHTSSVADSPVIHIRSKRFSHTRTKLFSKIDWKTVWLPAYSGKQVSV